MAEIALPMIVTAIANSELEGFVAGTLFSQGWNVIFRALDVSALTIFIDSDLKQSRDVVLVYSPDLLGISPNIVSSLNGKVRQTIGFSTESGNDQDFVGLFHAPNEPADLLNLVRGFVRAPLMRGPEVEAQKRRRATVIAIGSSAGSVGCTSLAINLAMELSALGRDTLLIDADVRHPSIAPLLSLHKLDAEKSSRSIAPHLSVSEFTRDHVLNLGEYLDDLISTCDFAIVDLGTVEDVSDSLTDRRWTSSMIHWSCERADELWLVGRSDVLGMQRLESLVKDFSQVTIRAKVSFVLSMCPRGRKGKLREDQYFAVGSPLSTQNLYTLPRDVRTLTKAEEERATLVEIDERSPLRKAIAAIAVGLTS
jgi:hypothetical protein